MIAVDCGFVEKLGANVLEFDDAKTGFRVCGGSISG